MFFVSFLFCFVFVFLLSLKPRFLVQSFFVLRYECAPTATRSYLTRSESFFVFFVFFVCFFSGDVAFCEYFTISVLSLYKESTRTSYGFFPCFSTLWPRAGLLTSAYVIIQAINQSDYLVCRVVSKERVKITLGYIKLCVGIIVVVEYTRKHTRSHINERSLLLHGTSISHSQVFFSFSDFGLGRSWRDPAWFLLFRLLLLPPRTSLLELRSVYRLLATPIVDT